jgi:hypothetical protein
MRAIRKPERKVQMIAVKQMLGDEVLRTDLAVSRSWRES